MKSGNLLALLVLIASALPCVRVAAQETPLTAGLTVEIRISGVPSAEIGIVNGLYPIGDGGSISLPIVGAVRAAGLKPSELARKIEQSYRAAEIYTRPIINVMVNGDDVLRRVTMGGNLRSPQPINYYDGMTLLEAILSCGGYNDFAKKEATLRRDGQIFEYRMKDIEKNPRKDPRLKPGDVVIVE